MFQPSWVELYDVLEYRGFSSVGGTLAAVGQRTPAAASEVDPWQFERGNDIFP
jgi:hypothetical protein